MIWDTPCVVNLAVSSLNGTTSRIAKNPRTFPDKRASLLTELRQIANNLRMATLKCLIPSSLSVDVDGMRIGSRLHQKADNSQNAALSCSYQRRYPILVGRIFVTTHVDQEADHVQRAIFSCRNQGLPGQELILGGSLLHKKAGNVDMAAMNCE